MKLNRKFKLFVHYFLGPVLFIWLSWSIYRQVRSQPDLHQAWQQIRISLGSFSAGNLLAVFLLMLVNWGVEAWKWQLVIKHIQQVSFIKAFRAVLSGVSFSVTMPNRVGEYLGRILYMDEGNRMRAISLTIISSISQVIITLAMGLVSLVILMPQIESLQVISFPWNKVIIYGVLAALLVLLLLYFRLGLLVKWLHRVPGSNRYIYLVEVLEELELRTLFQMLGLSALRFCVFILQYYLVFFLFDAGINWVETLLAASVNFLVLAVIPSFAIADIGLRGEVGLRLFGIYSSNNLAILMATVSVWFINLILPAIAGSLLILGIKKMWRSGD